LSAIRSFGVSRVLNVSGQTTENFKKTFWCLFLCITIHSEVPETYFKHQTVFNQVIPPKKTPATTKMGMLKYMVPATHEGRPVWQSLPSEPQGLWSESFLFEEGMVEIDKILIRNSICP
jgi:hypothetical protein